MALLELSWGHSSPNPLPNWSTLTYTTTTNMHSGSSKQPMSRKQTCAGAMEVPAILNGVAKVCATLAVEVPRTGGRRPKTQVLHLEASTKGDI